MPEFSVTKEIKLNFNIFNNKSNLQHGIIIRIEALDEFSIVLFLMKILSNRTITKYKYYLRQKHLICKIVIICIHYL